MLLVSLYLLYFLILAEICGKAVNDIETTELQSQTSIHPFDATICLLFTRDMKLLSLFPEQMQTRHFAFPTVL